MTSVIFLDILKTALARSTSSSVDSELFEGREVLMYLGKPVCEWVGSYLIYRRDRTMLILDTDDKFIEALLDMFTRYYSNNPS